MFSKNNRLDGQHVLWVTRSFLDYRVPVFAELHRLLQGRLRILYSREFTPERSWRKLQDAIGNHAVGLTGERSLGYQGNITGEIANSKLRFPYQPGLLKKIRELHPAVLIGDGFFQWTWPVLIHRLVSGTPVVACYERTMHTERHAQWYRTLFRKTMIRLIAAMSVNGRLSREYIESLGMRPDRITTGHMVADTETLAKQVAELPQTAVGKLKDQLKINSSSKVFLSVCRLIQLKGLDYLLYGWKKFKVAASEDCILLLVGDGPEREKLEQLCLEQNIKGVVFVGAVDYDDIHKYFALADVFVISTLEDNWSLVVPEAMACGKPIICSIYNGCWPELVHDGVNGWVFDPKDTGSIGDVFQRIMELGDFGKMGEMSQELIAQHTAVYAAEAILHACEIAVGKNK